MTAWVVLDFETADYAADSACAVAAIRIEAGRETLAAERLIRPPRRRFAFSWLHGITWEAVCDAPDFGAVWRELAPVVEGAGLFVAHNAPFDRGVLRAGLATYGLAAPEAPFLCTVRLARLAWPDLPNHRLDTVAAHVGVALNHHDAGSDARACAAILARGLAEGADWRRALLRRR